MAGEKPMEPEAGPASSDAHAAYLAGCRRGELVFSRCAACDHAQLAAFRVCVACGGTELGTEVSGGKGTVASFTVVHRAPSDFFRDRAPSALALVDLDEGFRALLGLFGEPAVGSREIGRASCRERVCKYV